MLNNNGRQLIESCKISLFENCKELEQKNLLESIHVMLQMGKVQLIKWLCQWSSSPKEWILYRSMDKCMSDVHCPVCIFFSCDEIIVTEYNDVENDNADNSNYTIKNNVTCKWNEQLNEQYTLAFDIEAIEKLHL